jgi:Methyltransferase domain
LSLFTRAADNADPNSAASRFRRERFKKFTNLIAECQPPVKILDVGGTVAFWQSHRDLLNQEVEVTLLNQVFEPSQAPNWITQVKGDARWMTMFADRQFDICFSNSVIEHVGTLYDQLYMAKEIRRVARGYFVQTPNKWFPLEPHFLVPCWQFLPVWLRARLLMTSDRGFVGQVQEYFLAKATVESIRLLTQREMRWLFPEAIIVKEQIGPLTKSLVACRKASV